MMQIKMIFQFISVHLLLLFKITSGPETRFTFDTSYQLLALTTFPIVKDHSIDMCWNRGRGGGSQIDKWEEGVQNSQIFNTSFLNGPIYHSSKWHMSYLYRSWPKTPSQCPSTPSSTTGCRTRPCRWPTSRTRITRRDCSLRRRFETFSEPKIFTKFSATERASLDQCRLEISDVILNVIDVTLRFKKRRSKVQKPSRNSQRQREHLWINAGDNFDEVI